MTTKPLFASMAAALEYLDRVIEDRDGYRAQLANHYSMLVDAQKQAAELAVELRHACSEAAELRDHNAELLCRVDELREERNQLKSDLIWERDRAR